MFDGLVGFDLAQLVLATVEGSDPLFPWCLSTDDWYALEGMNEVWRYDGRFCDLLPHFVKAVKCWSFSVPVAVAIVKAGLMLEEWYDERLLRWLRSLPAAEASEWACAVASEWSCARSYTWRPDAELLTIVRNARLLCGFGLRDKVKVAKAMGDTRNWSCSYEEFVAHLDEEPRDNLSLDDVLALRYDERRVDARHVICAIPVETEDSTADAALRTEFHASWWGEERMFEGNTDMVGLLASLAPIGVLQGWVLGWFFGVLEGFLSAAR